MRGPMYRNGVEVDLPPCPECGGHPVRIWMPLYGWDGRTRKNKHENLVYLHCACGECTTEWHKTLDEAKVAYLKKEWAVPYSQRPREQA